jgi:type I restriction enzyme S subunit
VTNGLPIGWEKRKIGDLCRLVNGRAFKPSEWAAAGLPIIRIQNLNDSRKPYNHFSGGYDPKHLVDRGDVLLSWSGTPGTSFGCFIWGGERGVLNQHIFKVLVDVSLCTPEFFVHAVNNALDEMIDKAHGGVGLRHITKGTLEQIDLPMAPLAEQARIVAAIRECLSRVEEIAVLQREWLAEAQAVFASCLKEFEETSEWPLVPVESVILDSQNGRSIRSDGELGNGKVLTLSAVRDIIIAFDCAKTIAVDDRVAARYSIDADDVFVSRSNTIDLVGLSAVAVENGPLGTIYPDLLIRLRPDKKKVLPMFLAHALRLPSVRKQIRARAKGTSQSMVKISGAELRGILFPLPPLTEQAKVVSRLEELRLTNRLVMSEFDVRAPRLLADSVLRKAFAGEL